MKATNICPIWLLQRSHYLNTKYTISTEQLLVDNANLLTLSTPKIAVLVGGLRTIGATYDNSKVGVLTDRKGTLSNDFFVNLLDMTYAVNLLATKKRLS